MGECIVDVLCIKYVASGHVKWFPCFSFLKVDAVCKFECDEA